MKLAPYPKYEPSGVEWLGDLPAHWEVMKLKKLVSFIEEKESEIDGENRLPYIGLEHIESWTGMLCVRDSEFVPTSVSNRFHSGDVLFGKLRPYLAKACKPSFEGTCSSELLALRPSSGIEGRFLLRLLLTKGFISLVDSSTYGAKMPRANWNDVSSCALPVPSLKEQRAIADFLDCEAAKIDKLIEKKRTLIERLKEKRAALITRTVTQGLPPDAAREAGLEPEPKMRASGVEWLGDVPAHWKMMKLKKLVSLVEERISEVDGENRLPYIGLEHIESWTGMLCVRDLEFVPTSVSNRFHSGDVLFGKLRPYLAKACKPSFEGTCSSELLALRPSSGIEGRFLLRLLLTKGFISLVDSSTYGAKMPRANWNDVSSCVLPVPPLKEQRAIADFLDRETAKIDGLVAKVDTAVARLREYRAALITAAVTGQVDVRGNDDHES